MKKSVKIIMLLSLLIFIAGLGAVAVGMTVLGWDFYKLDTHVYNEKFVDTSSAVFEGARDDEGNVEITKVVANVNNWSVKVTAGEAFSFKYYTTEYTVTEEISFTGGVVKINLKEDWKADIFNSFDTFGRSKKWKLKYELTLPDGIDVDLNFSNSDFAITNGSYGEFKTDCTNTDQAFKNTKFEKFISDCTNADMTFNGCEAGEMSITSTNIDVEITDCVINNKLYFKSTNGDLDITGTKVGGATEIVATNLGIKLISSEFQAFSYNSTNGRIVVNNVVMASLAVKGTNFTLRSDGYVDSSVFTFDCTNATINLNVLGAKQDLKHLKYSITNSTVRLDGDRLNSDYNGEGNKTIDAKGTNFTLRVTFTQNANKE